MKEIVPVRSAKDFEVKEKMEERKEWRAQSKSQRREVADLLVPSRPAER